MENNNEEKFVGLGETIYNENEAGNIPEQNENTIDNSSENEGYFGRPDKYDYSEVVLPEDYCYNEELLNEFNELASKYDLSQKGANELMSIAVKLTQMTSDNCSKLTEAEQRQKVREYKRSLINDSILGRGNFERTMQTANTAYEAFADSDVQRLLQETGLNCHPKIVNMFYQIGKNMQNDTFYGINSMPVQKESREDILYPTMS